MIPEENTNAEINLLKNQVFTLLVALIVVSGTLTIFLYRQVSLAGKDLAMSRQLDANISTNEVAYINVINRLVGYGEKHPEFVPVLKKYGIAPVPGVPAGSSMPTGSPVAPRK